MKVEKIAGIVNNMYQEYTGGSEILVDDMTKVVDKGREMLGAMDIENFTRKLIDHVGRMVFVDRVYGGDAPNVRKDGWQYASIMEKVQCDKIDATEDNSWDLQNGVAYTDGFKFKAPSVSAKFYNSKVTYKVQISYTRMQVESAFDNASQVNAFFSMIENKINNEFTIWEDSLIMGTINTMIASTVLNEFPETEDYSTVSGVKAINLLKLYNDAFGTDLDPEAAVKDKEFIRFASYEVAIKPKQMNRMNSLMNIGGKDRFTPRDRLHVVLLDRFMKAAEVYLESDTFHNNLVALPNAETVAAWQAIGDDFSFSKVSEINVKVKGADGEDKTVHFTGVLGVMFDDDCLGLYNQHKETTTQYIPSDRFFNSFYFEDCSYWNDENEQFVVFYVA